MCKSTYATTIQIWPSGRFSPKGHPQEMTIQTISYCLTGLQEARTTINVEETRGYHHLNLHHHPQITGWKVIGIQCQQPHWCHHCQTSLKVPSIPGEVDNVGRLEPTWKLIYSSFIFKVENAKDAVTYQSWRWDLMVYHCAGCRDHTLLPYAIWSLQGSPGELVWSSGMDITLDEVSNNHRWTL